MRFEISARMRILPWLSFISHFHSSSTALFSLSFVVYIYIYIYVCTMMLAAYILRSNYPLHLHLSFAQTISYAIFIVLYIILALRLPMCVRIICAVTAYNVSSHSKKSMLVWFIFSYTWTQSLVSIHISIWYANIFLHTSILAIVFCYSVIIVGFFFTILYGNVLLWVYTWYSILAHCHLCNLDLYRGHTLTAINRILCVHLYIWKREMILFSLNVQMTVIPINDMAK